MKHIMLLSALTLVCANMAAQTNEPASTTIKERTEVSSTIVESDDAPLAVGGWKDGWFVSAGAGVNTLLDNGNFGAVLPAVEVMVGKDVSPYWSIRLGYRGFANRAINTANGWFAGTDQFGWHLMHIDWSWDMLSTICGWKKDRLFHLRPFAQAGALFVSHKEFKKTEFAYGGGIEASFRVSKRIEVGVDAEFMLAREEAFRKAGNIVAYPSLTAQVKVALGNPVVSRKALVKETYSVYRVEVPAECGHDAQMKALQDEIDRLKKNPTEKTNYEGFVVYFALDKAEVRDSEQYHLMDLLRVLPEGAGLTIVGHADKETGNPKHNARLSERRVKSVENELRRQGFTGTILTDAKGDTQNPFKQPTPKNRCVTIKVTF